jgi:hypothetical protein
LCYYFYEFDAAILGMLMTYRLKSLCFFMLIPLFLVTSVQAQSMYTWTDENGVVHFSDVEPQGQQAQEQQIPIEDTPSTPDPYSSPGETQPSYADQRRQQLEANSKAAQQEQSRNTSRCASWQAEVNRLEPNRRVFYTNDQGETERMDDIQRTNRVAELKAQLAQNCN